MEFLEKLENFFNSGDPEVRKWFLVRNNYLPFIISFSYCIICAVGPSLMKNREPFNIRKIIVLFDFSIVILNTILLILNVNYLRLLTWKQFCLGEYVPENNILYTLAYIGWILYLSKYLEFFDTFFFILRKRDDLITFLHVFHHSFVPLTGWLLFRTEKSVFPSVLATVNAFVHVIMYMYYGLAAMGPKMRKFLWWKKYVTQLQIMQFVFMVLYITVYAPLSGCPMVISSYATGSVLVPFFLYFFCRFYNISYSAKEKKAY